MGEGEILFFFSSSTMTAFNLAYELNMTFNRLFIGRNDIHTHTTHLRHILTSCISKDMH